MAAVTKTQTLHPSEVASLLAPVFAELGATAAFLCGPYLRATRNGDLRAEDEASLFVVADIEGSPLERARQVGSKIPAELDACLMYPKIFAVTPDEAERMGGAVAAASDTFGDIEQIYG